MLSTKHRLGRQRGGLEVRTKKSRTLWRLDGICYNQQGSVENKLVFSLAKLDGFAYCPYCP
jgi:hypothetical protein